MTLQYNFNEMLAIPLCEYVQPQGDYECPSDGSYAFSLDYPLPSAGGESTSWLASGWAGKGTIGIYAKKDESMLIGQCSFNMKTYVTSDESRGIFQTPSAAAMVGIVLGSVAALVIVGLWWRCCSRGKPKKKSTDDGKSVLTRDDITTLFRRLDDETRSHLSTPSRRTSGYATVAPIGSIPPNLQRPVSPTKMYADEDSRYLPLGLATPSTTAAPVPPYLHHPQSVTSTVSSLHGPPPVSAATAGTMSTAAHQPSPTAATTEKPKKKSFVSIIFKNRGGTKSNSNTTEQQQANPENMPL